VIRATASLAPRPSRATRLRRPWLASVLVSVALALWVGAVSGDFEAGRRAQEAGDHAEAYRIWRPLAEGGDRLAQFGLGNLYDQGEGVPLDPAAAYRWFRLAAEQGLAAAQFNLGNAYKHGRGVSRDEVKAADWWRQAAERGLPEAQFNLGMQYYFGHGVPQNRDIALTWFRRAAVSGHLRAQTLFVGKDDAEAAADSSTPEGEGAPAAAWPGSGAGTARSSPEEDDPPPGRVAAREVPPGGAEVPVAPFGSPPPADVEVARGEPASPPREAGVRETVAESRPSGASSMADPGPALEREPWVLAQAPSAWTAQLFATGDETAIAPALRGSEGLPGPLAYYRFERDGRVWYAVLYGAFPDAAAAREAVAALPARLRPSEPWIREFRPIQALIRPAD
jgi:septal ring-binding cell division protein DamX